jgi:predicted AAA+ superfamily ATPase
MMQGLSKLAILEILGEWNYWNRDFETYVQRPAYRSILERYRRSKEIVVLTGIRRSGKSTLLKQEMEALAMSRDKKELLYINFEDPRLSEDADPDTLDLLLETYREAINPDGEVFLFLDEVQNVDRWEKWVRKAHDLKKATIYITGSSSKLLSGEVASSISGRYLQIPVYPLRFWEFLSFNGIECRTIADYSTKRREINQLFDNYLRYGGFPKVVLVDEDLKKEELLSYFNTILLHDILARYGLKNYDMLKKLVEYILTNDTKQNSVNSISKALSYNYATVSDYVDYLKATYMIAELRNYDHSLKKQLRSDVKYYCIDTGFVNAVSFLFSENIGRLYENIVFNEFVRRGQGTGLFFLNEGGYECDFITQEKGRITGAYQVCYELHDKNMEREVAALVMACRKFGLTEGMIITEHQQKTMMADGVRIEVLPVTAFLVGFG